MTAPHFAGIWFIRVEQRCRMNSGLLSAVSTPGIEKRIEPYRTIFIGTSSGKIRAVAGTLVLACRLDTVVM